MQPSGLWVTVRSTACLWVTVSCAAPVSGSPSTVQLCRLWVTISCATLSSQGHRQWCNISVAGSSSVRLQMCNCIISRSPSVVELSGLWIIVSRVTVVSGPPWAVHGLRLQVTVAPSSLRHYQWCNPFAPLPPSFQLQQRVSAEYSMNFQWNN